MSEPPAPAPPPATNTSVHHLEVPLGSKSSACLEFRPDQRRALVGVSVVGGSPEARLLLRLILQKKAEELGFTTSSSPPEGTMPGRDHLACGEALTCLWTESGRAAELARSWAHVLVARSAADFYGIRIAAIQAAQQLEDSSFEWRLQTALGALGRNSEEEPTRLALQRWGGAGFVRNLSVSQFEAEMRTLTAGAQLRVALPLSVQALSESLAVAESGREDSPVNSVELNRSSGGTTRATLVFEEKDGPEPALALLGWTGLELSSNEAALLELGLEIVRARFNLAHRHKTEVYASWSRMTWLAPATQLLLIGPAQNLPSAIDLMKDEFRRLVSVRGLPTEQELGRGLVQLRDLEHAPYLSTCHQPALAASPQEVASAIRTLSEPQSVLFSATAPPTEAE